MKIVFHVPELTRVQPCFNNIRNYLSDHERGISDQLYVIFNGDAVKALCLTSLTADNWQQLTMENPNLTLQVCHNSLNGLNITPETLITHIDIIPAAVVELIKLQKQGCIYLRP